MDLEPFADHSDGHSSDDDASSSRRKQGILRFSDNLQTWASEYPFPSFHPRRRAAGVLEEDEDGNLAAADEASDQEDASSDEEPGSLKPKVRIEAPHPFASDVAFDQHQRSWRQHMETCSSKSLAPQHSMRKLSLSALHDSHGKRATTSDDVCMPPVGRDEVAALLALHSPQDRKGGQGSPSPSSLSLNARGVDHTHMDLKWLHCKGSTPGCHLHLANLHLRIDASIHSSSSTNDHNTTLINSPRSAVVLLRRGIVLPMLLRRPWAKKRFTHMESFGSLDQLSYEERKEYTMETLRQQRLHDVVADYHALCEVTDADAVPLMCQSIINDRTMLSRLQHTRPASSLRLPVTKEASNAVAIVAQSRPVSALSHLTRRLEERKHVNDDSVMGLPIMVREAMRKRSAQETLIKISMREESTKTALALVRARREEKNVAKHGMREMSKSLLESRRTASAYRNLVLDQRGRQREEEADRYKEALSACSLELMGARRVAKVVEDRVLATRRN